MAVSATAASRPSAVVEFDIFADSYDTAGVPDISFMENGDQEAHLAESGVLPFPLYGETPIHAWISYDAAATELSVYAAPASAAKPTEPLFTYKVNLAEVLNSEYAFAGFTAGTGAGDAVQEVLDWQLSSSTATQTVKQPTVSAIAPESGSSAGNTDVTIKGTGFVFPATVTIGNEVAAAEVVSTEEIRATTSAHEAGSQEVVVSDSGGTSEGGPQFTYVDPPTVESITPSSGSTEGGTPVTVVGTGFVSGIQVEIDGQPLTEVEVDSATELTGTTSPGSAGAFEVVVSDAYGTSTLGPEFTYVEPPPMITELLPNEGPLKGGTEVTIVGTGFAPGASVSFGGKPASGVTVNSAQSITATAPPGSGLGTVRVTVETAVGGTEETFADRYSYVPAGKVGGLDVAGYCQSLGYDGSDGGSPAVLTRNGEVTGPNFAYENWACVGEAAKPCCSRRPVRRPASKTRVPWKILAIRPTPMRATRTTRSRGTATRSRTSRASNRPRVRRPAARV